ncbi:hypothetical protein [Roseinatronobacter sp.]|uniref:hypothetical protein n=1 Tax=Roseinatronobacter sp. TaxID=1945755 RepID=UPI0025F1F321|nr:hypothetical protein [Roseibaca sp.]
MDQNRKPESDIDATDAGEAAQRLARELHGALFPEEYDHMYDSVAEAKARLRGENPMDDKHVERVNEQRTQLGFTQFVVGPDGDNDNTFAWVKEQLRNGEEDKLREIVATRAQVSLAILRRKERARQQVQTPSWLDQTIDEMLSGDEFIYDGQDRTDPKVIAFRILGELYTVNRSGKNAPEFLRQIRRLLPGRSEAEYQNLLGYAKREWMEAYGY